MLRTLRDLLWISEFRVEVSEGEDREVWEAGELRYTESTVPPRRCGEDLWWVSGDGGLAADGIRTGEKRSGLVINLRDERRPQLTVDRRRLEGWDKDWVRQTIKESLPELMKWDGFTLSWLWRVADSAPAVAQQIFEYAVAAGHRVRVGTAREQSSTVALGVVGCMPEDQHGINQGIYSGYWMRNWRIGIWRNIASASSRAWWITPPEQVIGFPVPDPIDSALLGRIRYNDADEMWSRDAIMTGLADREFTVGALLRRLRRYAITGLNIAESRYVPTSENLVEDKDKQLLRALLLWARPGEPLHRDSVGPLLYSSSILQMPLGEVLRRAARLAPENWDAPNFDLGELRHHTSTTAEASLLSRDFSIYAPHWVSDALPPNHLARVSSNLGQPFADVLATCDRLAPLGVTVAMRAAYPENVEAAELQALSFADAPGYSLSPIQLVLVAGGIQTSVGAARTKLERLERNGLIDLPQLYGDPDFTPDESHLLFIQQYLTVRSQRGYRDRAVHKRPLLAILLQIVGRSGWEEKKAARDLIQFVSHDASLAGAELAEASYRLRVSLAEVVKTFSQVINLPRMEFECDSVTVEEGIYSALLRKDSGDIEWDAMPGSIVDAARYLREPLGDLLGRLDPFRRLGAPIPTYNDAVRESLNRVELDKYDVEMLCEFDEFGELVDLRTITPLQLVRIAGRLGWTLAHAHWRMVRLVPIGVELQYPADANLPEDRLLVRPPSPH